MQRRSTQGVVFVHACPKALCQHVEWALERVVGAPVSLSWADQPAAHGSYRAEVAWTGSPGTAARLVDRAARVADAALRGDRGSQPRQRRRADVLRARARVSSGRRPAPTATSWSPSSSCATSPPRPTSIEAFRHGVDELLGAAWDADLEVYRHAGDGSPVTWLHQVV